MFKIPAYQYRDIVDSCYGDMQGIGRIFSRYYLSINILSGKAPCFLGKREELYFIFFDNILQKRFFRFLGRMINLVYRYLRPIKGIAKQTNILKELGGFGFNCRVLSIKAVNNRRININSHIPEDTIDYCPSQDKANVSKDYRVTAYDAGLALGQGRGALEAAQIAHSAVAL